MTERHALAGAIGVIAVAGAAAALGPWRGAEVATTPEPVAAADTSVQGPDYLIAQRTKGSADAPMTLYEVADFQCPACRLFFTETMPHLMTEYVTPGKLRIIFINFPIVQIHANAAAAHEFAMCAARQDRFWPVHDLLYATQESWAPLQSPESYFMQLADSASLTRDALTACLTGGGTRGLVLGEAQSAFQAGVRSTPSFIVEGGLVSGAAPIEAWRPLLDSIYTVKTGN